MVKDSNIMHSGRVWACILLILANIIVSLFVVGSASFAWQGALVNAAAEGSIEEVKRLLASGNIGPNELVDALGIAANRGRVETMKLLLDAGANPNHASTQFGKETPLTMAVTRAEAVRLLLDRGAVPTLEVWVKACGYGHFDSAELVLDRWVETPQGANDTVAALIRYAIKGNVEQIRRILRSNTLEKISEDDWKMALTAAVAQGHPEIVREMIDSGAKPGATKFGTLESGSVHAETLLDEAVREGHADVVRVLLEAGIDLEKAREAGSCPLTSACREGRIDIVKLLLDKGVSANDGSALAAAAGGSYLPGHGGGHLDIVKLLVERGADVNAESDDCLDPSGDFTVTALQLAAREGHLELVRYLLEKGADPKAEMSVSGSTGDNAVTFAAWKGHAEIVKLFLEKGEDVNRPTSGGITALMAASSGGELETAIFLLDRGADVNAADKEGDTPLFYALRTCNPAVVKLLIEKGADPNIKNREGLTVIDIAQSEHLTEIAAILRAGRPMEVPKPEAK